MKSTGFCEPKCVTMETPNSCLIVWVITSNVLRFVLLHCQQFRVQQAPMTDKSYHEGDGRNIVILILVASRQTELPMTRSRFAIASSKHKCGGLMTFQRVRRNLMRGQQLFEKEKKKKQDSQCTYKVTLRRAHRKHCCSGKVINITYWCVCVCVCVCVCECLLLRACVHVGNRARERVHAHTCM
jgi:hypothetical protein